MKKILFFIIACVAMFGCAKEEQPDSYLVEGDKVTLTSQGKTSTVSLDFFSMHYTSNLLFYEEISSQNGVMVGKKSFSDPHEVRVSAYMYEGNFEIRRVDYSTAYIVWILTPSGEMQEKNLDFYYTVTEVYHDGEKIASPDYRFSAGDMVLTPLELSKERPDVYDLWEFKFPITVFNGHTGETIKEFELVLQTKLLFDWI